jgi:hypothetical protein
MRQTLYTLVQWFLDLCGYARAIPATDNYSTRWRGPGDGI